MRIFATRHGQVLSREFYGGNADFPAGDEPLTDLGKMQAKELAKELDRLDFHGKIFASPYTRTLETADIVAKELSTSFIPFPALREMFVTHNESKDFVGMTEAQINEAFPRAKIDFDIPYPWWEYKDDKLADVIERLRNDLPSAISHVSQDEDVLLIGHAATLVALREIYHPACYKSSVHWNCSLSLLDSPDKSTYTYDISFMPEHLRAANYMYYSEQRSKYENALRQGESFFKQNCGTRVLHIGDTYSPHYSLYKEMIERFNPDIIIHTGDLADEIKAGRVEEDKPRWESTVPQIIDIMKSSGARCIIVTGNNDIRDKLYPLAKGAEILPRNRVIEIGGKNVCLNHEVMKIDESLDVDVHLYGHGTTGETRTATDNVRGRKKYFNTSWGTSLHVFEKDAHLILPEIKL